MRKTVFISLLFLSISCKKEITEIRYYPTERLFSDKTSELIGLDTTQLNFKQITNKIGTHYNNYENLVVEFNDENIKKKNYTLSV